MNAYDEKKFCDDLSLENFPIENVQWFKIGVWYFNCVLKQIRTRKQVLGDINVRASSIIQTVYTKEGVKGFWKGVTARIWSASVSSAFLLTAYELVKILAKKDYLNEN